MCMYKRYIVNAIGQELLVKCGKCPACLQEHAISRANRIRNEYDGSNVAYFVTLTYRNASIPYIDLDEVSATQSFYEHRKLQGLEIPSDCADFKVVNVYRSSDSFWYFDRKTNKLRRKTSYKRHRISQTTLSVDLLKSAHLKRLQNCKYNRVGVSFYPDVQNFIKRLRIILKRNFNYEKSISFYSCSEYGPTTCRPHFHLLIFGPISLYSILPVAVGKAWSYDNYRRAADSVEIARNCASYVSSYVNCSASVPAVLAQNDDLRMRHSYSKGFGLGRFDFTLAKVLEKFDRGDLHYDVSSTKQGTLSVERMLLPSYVISRYFRKIKGYCCLNAHEIESICLAPSSLFLYARRLGYNDADLHTNVTMLEGLVHRARSAGIDGFHFAAAYARIWSLYYSSCIGESYSSIYLPDQNFFAYDNIADYYSGMVDSPSLDLVFPFKVQDFETDPNYFPSNRVSTSNLESWYAKYSKDKKIRNEAYANSNYHI